MATGDIGSVLYNSILISSKPKYSPLKVVGTSATYYLSASVYGSTPGAAVESYAVAANGAIGSLITRLNYYVAGTSVGGPISSCFRVGTTGNIYAMAYNCNNSPYQTRVCTFSIDLATGVLTKISDYVMTTLSANELINTHANTHTLFHIAGNVYVVFGYLLDSGCKHSAISFSISPDGVTISVIQHYRSTAVTGSSLNPKGVQLSQNYIATITRATSDGNVEIRTYNVTDAGAISLVDTKVLGTTSGSTTYYTDICRISGDVYLCGYTFEAGPTRRLISISISTTGVVGSVIDTDDTLLGNDCYKLELIAGFILMGTTNLLKTFATSTDGTIGAVIDSLSVSAYGANAIMSYTGVGNIFHGSCGNYVISTDVIIPTGSIESAGYSDLKYDRVDLWGNVLEVGLAEAVGFVWSLGTGNFENTLLSSDPIIPGLYNLQLTSLAYNTSYKAKAMLYDRGVYYYGDIIYFTTVFPAPEVTTEVASAADDYWIDAVGCLVDDGGADAVDQYGFGYGLKTIEDMLGLFDADLSKADDPNDCTGPFDYDACEKVIGTLVAPLLSGNAASGQKVVNVISATGLSAGMSMKLVDTDNEETLTIDAVVGLVVTMTTNLVNSYTTAKSARLCQLVTIRLRNLEYAKRYFFRFWAHNRFGWGWGGEMCALTSDTVNIMIPTATASKGIRFCIPGKMNFPPTGMFYNTRHHLLVKSPDSFYVSPAEGGGGFGSVRGKYVCERQYYSEATNVDLYTMSNAVRRTGVPVKVKYKARIGNNSYGLGNYHKRVINNGASSLTSGYMSVGAGYLAWYCEIFTLNPWTSAAWSVAETDDLIYGISIRSGTGWEQPLLDCIEGRICWVDAAVTTKQPRYCTPTSVQFNGLVTEDECEDCIVYFEYGPTVAYGSVTADQAAVKGQAFSAEIAYMAPAPETYYHYRTVIETACGETFYGDDMLYPNGLILELALEQSILTVAPVWTDVSTYCLKLHTKRGRLHELDRCEAGVASFILNNATGDWWRYNAAGAFYGTAGGVKPLTLARLRYLYNGINNVYYGVAESFKPKWLSESGGFTPVMELNCVDVFKSFTRYKIIDANPKLIEDATAGEDFVYVDSTRGLVEGQSIRIYEGDDKTQTTTILQVVASLNLVIFDDILAENYGTDARLKKFPAALSGRRMKDIILEAKWPSALTAIDDGTVTLVELSPKTGGDNLMEAAFKTMEAECGNLFVAANGFVTFHDAVARTKAPYNTSQATFSDDGTHSKYYLPEMSDDDEFIYNECDISGDAIGDQTMLDEDLQLEQGPRSIDKKDSPLADAEDAFDQATISVEKYKLPIPRCVALIVRPDADSEDLWPKVLGYDLGTRITLELNGTRNPACIDVPYHIEGVTCDWEASTDLWETKWQLWDVNKYYMFRCQHEGWLRNVWPEPYEYADIHDDPTAAFVFNDTEEPIEIGQLPYVAFSYNEDIRRGQLEFDTTDIDPTWTVANAKIIMMLRPQLILYDRIAFDLCVVGTYNSNQPLVLADYGNMLGQTTIYGSIEVPEDFREPDPFHPIGVYMLAVIELSAAGIAHINKGGTSRFWLRSKQDIDAVEPTGGNSEHVLIEGHLGDFAPRLLVQVEKEA